MVRKVGYSFFDRFHLMEGALITELRLKVVIAMQRKQKPSCLNKDTKVMESLLVGGLWGGNGGYVSDFGVTSVPLKTQR